MDLSEQLSLQFKGLERLMDADSRAILFRHPSLRGIPDPVVDGDGYALECSCSTLLCLVISTPAGMTRVLADPVNSLLPRAI